MKALDTDICCRYVFIYQVRINTNYHKCEFMSHVFKTNPFVLLPIRASCTNDSSVFLSIMSHRGRDNTKPAPTVTVSVLV